MRLKLKGKNLLITALTFVLLICLVSIGVTISNSFKDNTIEYKGRLMSIGQDDADWKYGNWETSIGFGTDSSNITITDNYLEYNVSDLQGDADEIYLVISLYLEENTVKQTIPKNSIKISLPTNLLKTSLVGDASWELYGDDGFNYYIGDDLSVMVYTGLPYCTVDCADEIYGNFYWTLDEDTGEMYISNSMDIVVDEGVSPGYNEEYYISYISSLDYVVPNEVYSNEMSIDFSGESFDYDDLETKVVYSGGTQGDEVSLDELTGVVSEKYDEWQTSEWGTYSGNNDFYLAYTVSGSIDYSDSFNLFIRPESSNGTLVAYSNDGSTFEVGDMASYNASSNNCSFDDSSDVTCTLVYAFNYNNQTSLDTYININAIATNTSGDITSRSFNYNGHYENEQGPVTPEYPSGTSLNTNLTTVNDDDGIGGINSIIKGESANVSFSLTSGADTVSSNNGQNINAYNLWDLTNGGTTNYTLNLSTEGMYLDDTYDSIGNIVNLASGDYEITSFSLIDDIEYNYVLNNNSYSLVESTSDTASKNVYAKINGEYVKIGTYNRSGNSYTFNASYTGVESVTSSDYKFKVTLPSNVTDIKVEYTGNKAAIYMGIVVDTKLKSSNSVQSAIEGESSIVFKEKYSVSAGSLSDSGYKGTYLTKLDTFSGANSSSSLNDKQNGSDSITFTDNFYEGISFDSASKTKALSLLNKQNSAVVYELLPKGATLDGNPRCKTYHSNNSCTVTVADTTNDYSNTERTMVKLNVSYNNNYYENTNKYESGFTIELDVLYSSESNLRYGQVLNKDVVYVSGGMLSAGYSSASSADSTMFSSEEIQTKLNSIDGNYQLFATNSIEVAAATVDSGLATLSVKNKYTDSYGQSSSVVVSNQYRYKLEYSFASEYEEITNLKFVDLLENNYGNKEHFNGYFDSVDVTALTNMGVNPTIYYATDLSLINVNNIDVTNTSIWSTTKPSDSSRVVAVVVDCGSYEVKGSDGVSPSVEIVMNAINEHSAKKAYNKGNIIYNQVGSTQNKNIESNATEVSLIKDTIVYEATGTGGSGTSSSPIILDDNFEYSLTLSNTSDVYEYSNVEFEFTVPQGLTIGAITGTSDYVINGNVITFTVAKLNPSQVLNITIDVDIVVGDNTQYTYNSESKITKLNNRTYNGTVVKTYHKVVLPSLEFSKAIKTTESGSFVSGTALVAKDEKYSYRISVKNTSSVSAKNVVVKDNVPSGVTVDSSSISNGGTYQDGVITWNISSISANDTLNLTYDVTLGNVNLGTRLSSGGTVELKNPFDSSSYLYNDSTNVVTAYYQVASDMKITNKINGPLADSNKLFTYTVEFNGTSDNAGSYDVVDKNNNKVGTLTINNEGKGTYTANLKGSESVQFKLLTSGIEYSIKLKIEEGYEVSSDTGSIVSDNYVITGTTDETRIVSYELTNSYDVSTTQIINAKVTYDKEMTDGMFKVSMEDEEKDVPASGNVTFNQITYDNVVGQYTYKIKQINTGVTKVKYDTTQYTATVNVVNDGKGHLTSSVKYYDSNNKEVSSATFSNKYVPSGFMIVSDNTSDYIDKDKSFEYTLDFNSSDGLNGSYVVKDNGSKELESLVFENGVAHYEFTLGSDETILFVDLPNGINYTISQKTLPYYTTVVRKKNIESADSFVLGTDQNDTEENGTVGTTGVTSDDTTVVTFDNYYKTTAEYQVVSKIALVDKKLEDGEFSFKITDISSGSTKGYTETVKNNAAGEITFKTINYNVPGTYKYEIKQIKGTSNHIYYDLEKIVLTLVLTDNGDGTMRVLDTYEYFGEETYFVNKYSKDPIVPENKDDSVNPNTLDRSWLIASLLIVVILLMVIEGRVKIRSYRMRG